MYDVMKRKFPLVLNLQTFADGDDDGGDDSNDDKGGGDGNGNGADPGKRTVTMTQAELDALIAREKGRAKKPYADYDELKAERDRLKAEEDKRARDAMSEAERLKAEKDEADRKASDAAETAKRAQESANKRVLDAEIRSIARALNANDANDVLSFVDKSAIAIDDDGNVTGVEEAVKALKESKPYLFKASVGADAAGGSDPHRNPNKSELAGLEKELEDLKKAAAKDSRLIGKVTAVYNKILELKAKK